VNVGKKGSLPDGHVVVPRTNTSTTVLRGGTPHATGVVGTGKGRSPKQVNEDMKNSPVSRGTEPSTLNYTTKAPGTGSYMDPLPSLSGPTSLEMLQEVMLKANLQQRILNQDKFPALGEEGLVLIVQVHKREGYLKQLLESLRATRGIQNVLLVLSHDYYFDDMNRLIQSIDFCPVSDSQGYSFHK
jgi:hypothetical protein